MLQRVQMEGIELPRLYIAENRKDAELAKSKGIPFIRWTQGQDAFIKILLRPVLEKIFPHIKWTKVLGPRKKFKTKIEIYESEPVVDVDDVLDDEDIDDNIIKFDDEQVEMEEQPIIDEDDTIIEVADMTNDERLFDTKHHNGMEVKKLSIEDYVGDLSSQVNLDVLQRLRLMPAFIGDILECVRLNIGSGLCWSEGYNKRLGLPVGRFNSSKQLPNLIILDVSGSIPRGISATMLSLIDTLRTQLSADLIITSSQSKFYKMGDELPSPQKLRDQFGYGNESFDFIRILNEHVKGRHYGHVISFGDYDTPRYYDLNLIGTEVEHVHHYHTHQLIETGYAKWCHMLAKKPEVSYETKWCSIINS